MTIKEAYEILTENCENLGNSEVQNIAIEVMKKQIPTKAMMNKLDDYHQYAKCPCCNKGLLYKHDYCCHCGQALDWS